MEKVSKGQLSWDDLARKSHKDVTKAEMRTEMIRRAKARKAKKSEKESSMVVVKGFLGYGSLLGLFILLNAVPGHAVPQNVQYSAALGPVASTSTITINRAGASNRNCLTNVAVVSDAQSTFRMLSGGTTTYQVPLSSGTTHVNAFGADDPWCTVAGSTATLKVDTGNFIINYHGYQY